MSATAKTTTGAASIGNNLSHQRPLITFAWVDQSIGEAGQHKYIKDRFETLSPFISKWLYFDSSDEFTSYIESNSNMRMMSVMSGGMSRLLVPRLSHHAALHIVYVFCVDVERARKSMEGETKVKGIFTIEDEVYEQMANDLSKLLVEEGIALAGLDQRSQAKLYYEEAKRLLRTEAKSVDENERKTRTEEINIRIEQLLA
ncbi:unnamed protein product [Adineta steineri]|uniref:Uncharacterized protein n=1 Tax=Adineta steineri TaxID=433720 RepID=A0A813QPG8_9BILA|nr:unnamed protein product [Adineta steineri]